VVSHLFGDATFECPSISRTLSLPDWILLTPNSRLAIWAIGAKPAFINYNLTGKALAHCIRVSTSKVAFVDAEVRSNVTQELRDELPGIQFEVFTPELEADIAAIEPVREPDSARTDDKASNMAIVIYTSGTTGLPKGAIVRWKKIIVGTGIVCPWMWMTQKDVFYTVSTVHLYYFPS
jgi:acyl-coenzyme A synthetase/AMP-(fatty) acid ligase